PVPGEATTCAGIGISKGALLSPPAKRVKIKTPISSQPNRISSMSPLAVCLPCAPRLAVQSYQSSPICALDSRFSHQWQPAFHPGSFQTRSLPGVPVLHLVGNPTGQRAPQSACLSGSKKKNRFAPCAKAGFRLSPLQKPVANVNEGVGLVIVAPALP